MLKIRDVPLPVAKSENGTGTGNFLPPVPVPRFYSYLGLKVNQCAKISFFDAPYFSTFAAHHYFRMIARQENYVLMPSEGLTTSFGTISTANQY